MGFSCIGKAIMFGEKVDYREDGEGWDQLLKKKEVNDARWSDRQGMGQNIKNSKARIIRLCMII